MDLNGFWAVVEDARLRADGDWTEVPGHVADALSQLAPTEIVDFAQIQDELVGTADREDLFTACRLINAGFPSTDGFLYFRQWLLVQGRAAFEAALADPDSLIDVPGVAGMDPRADDVFADCEELLSVASTAWRTATGIPEPTIRFDKRGNPIGDDGDDPVDEELERRGHQIRRGRPDPPAGDPIDFDDRDAVGAALPRLSARFYDQAHRSLRQARGSFLKSLWRRRS